MAIYHADKGQGLPKHSHVFAHATMCTSGSFVVRKEGRTIVMDKNSQPILLKHGEWHEIEALEDGTVITNIAKAHAVDA